MINSSNNLPTHFKKVLNTEWITKGYYHFMKTNYTKSMSIIPEFKRAFTNMKSAKYRFPNLNKGVQNNDSYTPIHFDHECENTNHSK